MKTKFYCAFLSLALLSAGCKPPPSSDDIKKDTDKIISDFNEKNKKTLADADDLIKRLKEGSIDFTDGGAPGVISLAGVIVSSQEVDGKKVLKADPRIYYEAVTGKSYLKEESGNAQIPDRDRPVLQEKPEPKETVQAARDLKNYIAIGCKKLDPNWIVNLQETKFQSSDQLDQMIQANTVVLCDLDGIKTAITLVHADHLILNRLNFDLKTRMGVAGLNLSARKLTLVGASQIQGRGDDVKGTSSIILMGPSISVEVFEELAGEGSLSLKTVGGNRLKAEKP